MLLNRMAKAIETNLANNFIIYLNIFIVCPEGNIFEQNEFQFHFYFSTKT